MVIASTAQQGPAQRSAGGAAPRILAGVVLAILGGLNCLFWVAAWGLHCFEDGCPDTGTWREDVDAWQWSAMGWLGIASFAFSVASAIALARRSWLTPALLCASLLTGIAPWIIYATG
jgi:hypothetical protein